MSELVLFLEPGFELSKAYTNSIPGHQSMYAPVDSTPPCVLYQVFDGRGAVISRRFAPFYHLPKFLFTLATVGSRLNGCG